MEDLIKELAVQAGAELFGVVGKENIIVNDQDADALMRKFAMLLIRECAKFLDENSGSDCTNNVWYPEPEELLKHFGVEE